MGKHLVSEEVHLYRAHLPLDAIKQFLACGHGVVKCSQPGQIISRPKNATMQQSNWLFLSIHLVIDFSIAGLDIMAGDVIISVWN
ncbi:hypothetical protein SAMN05661012_04005 [Chitinophaga sancti]|uniref:Uncharacterized protein n=1 Tax=Chitinophaga sancti TaxID=1004 RepID=A0A1K1RMB3_9BACT|nr:hypothetical protein SAMN05661012_04005 [Chitinophaga sancti]